MSVSHNNLSWTTQSKGTSSTTHALSYCWVYYAQSRVLPLRLLQHCDPAHSRAALHPVACSMPITHTLHFTNEHPSPVDIEPAHGALHDNNRSHSEGYGADWAYCQTPESEQQLRAQDEAAWWRYLEMARLARTLMTTKAATMKMPDRTADTIVMTGDTFLLPLNSSPMSLARLPT